MRARCNNVTTLETCRIWKELSEPEHSDAAPLKISDLSHREVPALCCHWHSVLHGWLWHLFTFPVALLMADPALSLASPAFSWILSPAFSAFSFTSSALTRTDRRAGRKGAGAALMGLPVKFALCACSHHMHSMSLPLLKWERPGFAEGLRGEALTLLRTCNWLPLLRANVDVILGRRLATLQPFAAPVNSRLQDDKRSIEPSTVTTAFPP